jgi:hypothetical protein
MQQALKSIGFEAAFAILTAYNPFGHHADEKENCRRINELVNDLNDLLVTMIPADGVSLDGNHRERGYAVAIPRRQAKTLTMKYGVSAVFWFDGEQFWIMPALITSRTDLPTMQSLRNLTKETVAAFNIPTVALGPDQFTTRLAFNL